MDTDSLVQQLMQQSSAEPSAEEPSSNLENTGQNREYQVREEDIRGAVRRLSFEAASQSPYLDNNLGFACINPTLSDQKMVNVL